jgi:hypothetical protein
VERLDDIAVIVRYSTFALYSAQVVLVAQYITQPKDVPQMTFLHFSKQHLLRGAKQIKTFLRRNIRQFQWLARFTTHKVLTV